MVIPPAREGCHVMGSEGDQRVFSIAFGREKSAATRALEEHDLIRPDAPFRQRLAAILGNGAEVLAHHDALVFHAGYPGHHPHRLQTKTHLTPPAPAPPPRHDL